MSDGSGCGRPGPALANRMEKKPFYRLSHPVLYPQLVSHGKSYEAHTSNSIVRKKIIIITNIVFFLIK